MRVHTARPHLLEDTVDLHLARRVAPPVYGVVVVLVAVFASGALLPVVVVGALLIGLLFATTGRSVDGRDRQRRRRT